MPLMKTRKQRARFYATGHATVGKISTYHRRTRTFKDWYVGRLRGVIVPDPKTNRFKFTTAEQARRAAHAFKEFSARIAGIK